MTIDTANEGGKRLQKVLQIQIAAPHAEVMQYKIEGDVERVYTLRPKIVRLVGRIGEEIKTTVEIVPEAKYPFSIVDVQAKNAEYIRYELAPVIKADGSRSYVLTVENKRKKKGRFFDNIYLRTDSPVKPEITVGVFGFIKG